MQIKWIVLIVAFLAVSWFIVIPALDPVVHYAAVDAKASVAVGDALLIAEKPDWSRYWYTRAFAKAPNDSGILKRIGAGYLQTGQTKNATEAVDLALAIDRNDTAALQQKGLILAKEGNYAGAVAYYDRILATNPSDANTLVMKGDALLASSITQQKGLRDYARNISAYQNTESPGSVGSYDAMKGMESYRTAVESYQKAMQINPALTVTITGKIMSATMNQVDEYQSILNDLNAR